MGKVRNGARTFLDLAKKLCKLSHLPGFQPGLIGILGPDIADTILVPWNSFCIAVEAAVSIDDNFNRLDAVSEKTGDEDVELA